MRKTASIFGEGLVFEKLLAGASKAERRALLAGRIEDGINTVVRQIAFHRFETQFHEARRQGELSPDEIGSLWIEVMAESLGPAVRLAALLAGIPGRPGQAAAGGETALEGEGGFYHSYAGNNLGQLRYSFAGDNRTHLEKLTAGLGTGWMFLETLYRIYSIAGYNIAHIDVTAALCEEHDIKPENIDRIEAVVNWLETQYPSPAFPARREDAAEIARIYNEGIEDRLATFETDLRGERDILRWFDEERTMVVVEEPHKLYGVTRISDPEAIQSSSEVHLCEPGVDLHHHGLQILPVLRARLHGLHCGRRRTCLVDYPCRHARALVDGTLLLVCGRPAGPAGDRLAGQLHRIRRGDG